MDFQTRKLNIISYLNEVQDENFLREIENFILDRKINTDRELRPFTTEEFIERIEKSEKDFQDEKYKTQAELEKISKNW